MSELLRDSISCKYCGKVIERHGFKGRLEDQLRRHQETRECLKARVSKLETVRYGDLEQPKVGSLRVVPHSQFLKLKREAQTKRSKN